ncbi:MAG TPA: hypothetical protein VFB80_17750 [Pirellulaceae bacterium]|nr:hypothetical protein [Pirellulaceae bacterium]
MNSTWFLHLLPILCIWLAGGLIAIVRWHRHPGVCALVVLSIVTMIAATSATHIAVQYFTRSNSPVLVQQYLAMTGLVNMLLRTIAWGAILTAVFGWRPAPIGVARPMLQFSIRGLLTLTLAVALLCAAGRAIVGWLGGVSQYWISIVDDLPMAICWLCGVWIAIRRWPAHPPVSAIALAAIALSAASFLAFHLVWMSNLNSGTIYLVQWASLLSGIIAPIVWALLLAAALGWRADATAAAQSA